MLTGTIRYMKYTSDNFQLHHLSTYKLFVKTDFLNDTLLVLDDKQTVQALYIYNADNPYSEAIKLLALPFPEVYINLPVQSLLLLPAEVFNEEDKNLYQEFLQDDHEDRTLIHHFPSQEVVACYQYDLMLYNKWSAIFPEAIRMADFQTVLKEAPSQIPVEGEIVGLHVRDMHIELYVYKNGQLQLYTFFEVQTSDDLAYFMLNTMKSLDMPARVSKLLVSGVDDQHEYSTILMRFSDNVVYQSTNTKLETDSIDVQESIAVLNTLIDSELCEL